MKIYIAKFGHQHPDVANVFLNWANILVVQKDYNDAEEFLLAGLLIFRNTVGTDSTTTVTCMSNLALVQTDLKKFDEAKALFRELLPIRRRIQGDAPNQVVAEDLYNFGRVLLAANDPDEAIIMQREALQMREALFGESAREVGDCIHEIARCLEAKGDNENAELEYRKAIAVFRSNFLIDECLVNQGKAQFELGRLMFKSQDSEKKDEAKGLMRSAQMIFLMKLGPMHPTTMQVTNAVVLLDMSGEQLAAFIGLKA
jgi:tetratricopeptide (TPR) repeat protein